MGTSPAVPGKGGPVSAGEDDYIYWQDALELVLAGRPNNIKCPFCHTGEVAVVRKGGDGTKTVTRLQCQNQQCRHYIEGRFGEEDLAEG